MGFEITKGAVFYFLLMLIVVYIGIALVVGTNPLEAFSKMNNLFEPAKVNIADSDIKELEKYVKLDCSATAPLVILENIKFYYKGQPSSMSDYVEFMILLDYNNRLFLGHNAIDGTDAVKCGSSEDGDSFQCSQTLKIEFNLVGIGNLKERDLLHFTIWQARPAISTAVADGTTFRDLLESYPESYISSFDVIKERVKACQETECSKQKNEPDCQATPNCYWGPWYLPWSRSCSICPSPTDPTDCDAYDRDQCTQCPTPKLTCQVTLTGGCEPK